MRKRFLSVHVTSPWMMELVQAMGRSESHGTAFETSQREAEYIQVP